MERRKLHIENFIFELFFEPQNRETKKLQDRNGPWVDTSTNDNVLAV